jgi:Holliday junction resolvasome RuvABC ATP-dependent DNA helicase subunit
MYIRRKDLEYFYSLLRSLDEEKKKRLAEILRKDCEKRSGKEEISEVIAVDERTIELEEIEPEELLTRTMIKKALKAVMDEK